MNRNNHNFPRKAKLAKLLRGDWSQAALKDLERLIRRHNMPLTRNTSVGPKVKLMRQNLRTAKRLYRGVTELQLSMLREIGASLQLSISSGDLILLEEGGTSRILDSSELRGGCGAQASLRNWQAMFRI